MKRRDLLKTMAALPISAAAGTPYAAIAGRAEASTLRATAPVLPLRPGEITFLAGRPSNGKTTLATSIALDFIRRGGGDVWYFNMSMGSQKQAQQLGMQTQYLQARDLRPLPDNGECVYQASVNGQPQRLFLFDEYYGTESSIPAVAEQIDALAGRLPGLVIYDDEWHDVNTGPGGYGGGMAYELSERRAECRATVHAPILVATRLPSGADTQSADKRPRIWELTPWRGKQPLVDEVTFVHRPKLYAEDTGLEMPDVLQLTRSSRVGPERQSKLLARDGQALRFRDVTYREARQVNRVM